MKIVQYVRRAGRGGGVSEVVARLDLEFKALGIQSEVVDVYDLGYPASRSQPGQAQSKLALFAEVVFYTIVGTLAVRRRRRLDPSSSILVHSDPLGGDAYVNHGLLKEVMKRRANGSRFFIPLNPMHWFTLARDEIRYASRFQSEIVCLTTTDVETLRELYPRLKVPVTVIPNGVDLVDYHVLRDDARAELRRSLGWEDHEKVSLFVGHEFDRKGLYLLIDALAMLPEDHRLCVVGGDSAAMLRATERAQAMGVASRISFLGRLPNAIPQFQCADLFVFPTHYESFGLVLIEALACGTPIVSTNTGALRDLLDAGEVGLEITERSAAGVAHAVNQILDEIDLLGRNTIASRCREVAEGLQWRTIASRYLELASLKK